MKVKTHTKMHGYQCDGMPSMMGCGSYIEVPRPWKGYGLKASRWLVTPDTGDEDKPCPDPIDLHFCPPCAQHVIEQARKDGHKIKVR